ncbi:MAG TPA: S1 RNA-binding domain-containing protein [Polyangiaceae bacterium]|nr:S1 RNA-binding domain-containing protein [Polyangiaceae bacterium]
MSEVTQIDPNTASSSEASEPSEPNTPAQNHDAAAATATSSEVAPSEAVDDAHDGEEGDDDESGEEDGAEGETASVAADGAAPGETKKKKRRRKKKKAGGEAHHASERAPFHVGEEVFGKVTAVLETAIMVDLSGKALAIFDRHEMEPDDLVPEIGERFLAKVQGDGARGGLVVLTRKPLREEEAKPKLEQAAKDGTLVSGLVTGVIKGGVEVLLDGLRAFAPASGVDLHPRGSALSQLVGKRLDFKVTTFDKQGREVVVTRRPMLEKEAHERRKKARETLTEGMELDGVVRTVVDWGAFVALPEAEYLEGLVHASELSHDPRERVAEVLKPGQKFRVRIQKIDEKGKIWLSRKALLEDPYGKIFDNVKPGDILDGEVVRVEEFGAFVRIAEGVDGLLHAADLGLSRVDDARKVVSAGQTLRVLVHHFDEKQRRIALHPAPTEEQQAEGKQKVIKNGKLAVEVVKVDVPGLTVRILGATGRHARGFVPAAQTGTQRGAELKKHFTVGQKLEVLVVEVERGEAKLSIGRLAQDEERRAHKEYRDKVKAESKFGTLGDLLKQKLGG